jgi:ABC-type phosphate/phosphonate transport system substrate-binding protein
MERLRLVTYLGRNTVPIAAELAAMLTVATGIDVEFDPSPGWTQRLRSIENGEAELYWMCGLLTIDLIDSASLDAEIVAAPAFAPRTEPVYHSVIVSTAPLSGISDLAGRRLAINEEGSWSGNHALRAHLAENEFAANGAPGVVVASGGHEESIEMLLDGTADVASIDDTIWDHRTAEDPRLGGLFVIDRTRDWPAPPFSLHHRVRADLATTLRAALTGARPRGLSRIVPASGPDYDPIRKGMETSRRLGW